MPFRMSADVPSSADRRQHRAAFGLFLLMAGFHFWGATVAWRSLNLPGAEFRQAQTAISAYHIQRDADFSLAYPTPVLGKPWSIPMEFPLYQWTVVGLSNLTGAGLTPAGRAVSLGCFYLMLPAAFLLLGRLGLAGAPRWIALGLMLTCPLYIYYARAFLIETMALMFAAWFLVAFLRAVEQRSVGWLVAANFLGAAAGLVKVTTFMLFLLPAGFAAARALWAARSRPLAVAGWIAAAVAVPFALTLWWLHFADAAKQLNPSAQFLASGNMTDFNFGTTATRFSFETLQRHWRNLTTASVWPPVLAAGVVLALTASRRWWRPLLTCLACYLAVLVLFPVLYSLHEYYGVANTVFLLAALGFALAGLWEARWPRWATALVVLGVMAGQMQLYLRDFYPGQNHLTTGGSGLTQALRQVTERTDILVIAGDDWSSITPYFAERRALMIRNGQENRAAYLDAAFATLRDEHIGAVVLAGDLRGNNQLLDRLIATFELDRRAVFTWRDATVYLPVETRTQSIRRLHEQSFNDVVLSADAQLPAPGALGAEWRMLRDLAPEQRAPFAAMTPQPAGFYSSFGPALEWRQGEPWFNAHPTTRLRFDLPAGHRHLRTKVILPEAAYAGDFPTDGVEIRLTLRQEGAVPRQIYTRLIDPARLASDRGEQAIDVEFELARPASVDLFFGPGAHGRDTHDWISLGRVTID